MLDYEDPHFGGRGMDRPEDFAHALFDTYIVLDDGSVVEAYVTHRIHPKFIVKGSYIKYMYDWSGSGWQVGAPKDLKTNPILGFPTYEDAGKFAVSITARF